MTVRLRITMRRQMGSFPLIVQAVGLCLALFVIIHPANSKLVARRWIPSGANSSVQSRFERGSDSPHRKERMTHRVHEVSEVLPLHHAQAFATHEHGHERMRPLEIPGALHGGQRFQHKSEVRETGGGRGYSMFHYDIILQQGTVRIDDLQVDGRAPVISCTSRGEERRLDILIRPRAPRPESPSGQRSGEPDPIRTHDDTLAGDLGFLEAKEILEHARYLVADPGAYGK